MGLDISHNAFRGAYSAFNALRQAVAWATDGSFPPHLERRKNFSLIRDENERPIRNKEMDEQFWYINKRKYPKEKYPGLYIFLRHPDDSGSISPESCIKVADDLEKIIPIIKEYKECFGHIAHQGGFAKVLQKFIDGCRLAAKNNESLIFR